MLVIDSTTEYRATRIAHEIADLLVEAKGELLQAQHEVRDAEDMQRWEVACMKVAQYQTLVRDLGTARQALLNCGR